MNNLRLNGKYVRLGSFKDISWKHDLDQEIEFKLKIKPESGFRDDDNLSLSFLFSKKKESKNIFDISILRRFIVEGTNDKGFLKLTYETDESHNSLLKWQISPTRCLSYMKKSGTTDFNEEILEQPYLYSGFPPARIYLKHKPDEADIIKDFQNENHTLIKIKNRIDSFLSNKGASKVTKHKFIDTLSVLFEEIDYEEINKNSHILRRLSLPNKIKYAHIDKLKKYEEEDFKEHLRYLSDVIQRELFRQYTYFIIYFVKALKTLGKELDKISFIGPLREEPALRYICEDQKLEIGNRGENAPLIYESEKNNTVDSTFVITDDEYKKIKGKTISQILNRWSDFFGFGTFKSNIAKEDKLFKFQINKDNLGYRYITTTSSKKR
ncbi:MAG: hypothetical protein GF364_13320 [Candidatus Lokiarchaeota archaeon]|nr:hypothetical protein [Candidatus Lokiarchaeota archaeon]